MKYKLTLSLLLVVAIQTLNAQSCQSLFSGAENIYNSTEKSFINFRGSISKDFVDFVIPGNSKSESSLNRLIDDATNLQLKLYSAYGILAGQGNGKIGDISLIIPVKTFTGECFTERTFTILQSPYDKIVITVKKTDGRRGLKMKACAKYSNGSIYDEQSKEIESGNGSAGDSKTFTFSKNMSDKNISLHLVASGGLGPTDKCAYSLSIQGYFDNDQMIALNEQNNKSNNGSSTNAGNKSKTTQSENPGDQSINNSAIKETENNSTGVKLDQNNSRVVRQKNNKQNNPALAKALSNNETITEKSDQQLKEEATMNTQGRNKGRNKNAQRALSTNEGVPENSMQTETQTTNKNNRQRNRLGNNENASGTKMKNTPATNNADTKNTATRGTTTGRVNGRMKNSTNNNLMADSVKHEKKPINQRTRSRSGQRNGN